MGSVGNSVRDLSGIRILLTQRRGFSKSVELKPRLKEMLNPPPPKPKPKRLPRLEDIKIPPRVERGPTDILKALSSTVGRDYTAPHYKFHDDPYLIPYSNMTKRSYALSKEAGRKAAKWVRQQHPDLFQHREAEPPIESFLPTPVITEEMDLSEADLQNYMQQGLFQEAVQVHDILTSKGKEISDQTKQSFLEFICYFNEIEPVEEEMLEERWYRASNNMKGDRLKNMWKAGGLAQNVFNGIENPSVEAYCTMIRGQAKYFDADRAWTTYNELRSKGLTPDIETFNALIRICNFLRENADLRFQLLEELLTQMQECGAQPNLGTLNAILESLSMIGNPKAAKQMALATMSEFKNLGVEPSLATYYHLLAGFCKERGPTSRILVDILQEIQNKEFTIQDPKDVNFFVMAMDVARNHLQDLDLAHQVDQLLHTGKNYDLIGDAFMESVYYRHYMALRCVSEPFDEFMAWYSKIVPNIYTPEPGIMVEILKAVELNTAITYIPQLWSDIVVFDQANRENNLSLILSIMANYYPTDAEDLDLIQQENLCKQFTEISWKIWRLVEDQDPERRKQVTWSGHMLGDLIKLQVRGGEFEKASDIIRKLLTPEAASDVIGVPPLESLELFLKSAMTEKNGSMCLACLHYMNECGFPEVKDLGQEVFKNVQLDSLQLSKLSNLTGMDFQATAAANSQERESRSSRI